jgi:hypothetical protein
MRLAFIEEHRDVWPVTVMCEPLPVSPQGFDAWRSRPTRAQQQRRDALLVEMRALQVEFKQRYGSPRMHRELQARGVPCSHHTVAKLMRAHGMARPVTVRELADRDTAIAWLAAHSELPEPGASDTCVLQPTLY